MINRAELKFNAKKILKNNYWLCFAVCIITSLISNTVSSVSFNIPVSDGYNISSVIQNTIKSLQENIFNIKYIQIAVLIIFIGFIILSVCFDIFLFKPLNVAKKRFFVKSSLGEASVSTMIDIFKSEYYMNVVKTCFMKELFLFLWSMVYIIAFSIISVLCILFELPTPFITLSLFAFIPYIIKFYSYFAVEYILSENPDSNWRDIIKKSKQLMKKYRFQTFKLQLSFVGLFILGAMLCGIGIMFVFPYYEATMVQLYFDLENKENQNNFRNYDNVM